MLTPVELVDLLKTGSGWFDGEAVDELTHALQTANLAQAAGADDELITAAALHDSGRLAAFARQPWAADAAALRRWDDLAKVPGAPTATLDELVLVFARSAALRGTSARA
jgi:predicted HD phosphohydrolase